MKITKNPRTARTTRARRASSGRAPGSRSASSRLARQPAGELRLGAPPQPRLAQHVDEDLVAVAVDERVEVEERAHVGGEREVEEDVADGAVGAAAGSTARTSRRARSPTPGPAALIAIRRRRGSNHASDVSTNAYGKMNSSLKPARSTLRPNEAIASAVRALVDRAPRGSGRPGTRGRRARSSTRRRTASRSGRRSGRRRRRARPPISTAIAISAGRGEQHPAAGAVEALEERPDAARTSSSAA